MPITTISADEIPEEISRKLVNMSFFSTLLVVLIHCYIPSERGSHFWWFTEIIGGGAFATGGLVRIAVPYFFVQAGYLLAGHMNSNNWWKQEVYKRVLSLIVPYFVWCFVFCLLMFLRNPDFFHAARLLGLDLCALPGNIPLWFLRSLFVLVLLSPYLLKIANPVGLFVLFGLYVCRDVGLLSKLNILTVNNAFWDVTMSLLGVFYFTLGIYFRRYPLKVCFRSVLVFGLGIVAGISLVSYAWFDLRYSAWALGIRVFAIPVTLGFIWSIMPSSRLPTFLRRLIFPTFLLHYIFLYSLYGRIGFEHAPVIRMLLLFTVSLVASSVLAILLRLFAPKSMAFAFGGR